MKAILFILAVCGFYYGANQYALSEAPVTRWLKTSQFPDSEGAKMICDAVFPLTEATLTVTTNGIRPKVVIEKADDICPYYQSQIIAGASLLTSSVSIKQLDIQKLQKFPFNQATITTELTIRAANKRKGDDKKVYTYSRNLTIEFSRGFLGDYRILSLKGTGDIIPPEDSNKRN